MLSMHRLVATALIAFAPLVFAGHSSQTSVFYPEGVNRHDGMGAVLDFGNRRLSVAGDMFELNKCMETEPQYCFSSDYMNFSAPPKGKKSWVVADVRYLLAGQTVKRIKGKELCVDSISSEQKTGRFSFYFNQGVGLIGWRIEYTTLGGEKASEEYWLDKLDGMPTGCAK